MITGAADPRALDGQLRSREEALRQVTRDEAAVVLACERLDHARHALGLLHVLAARLAALEADRTDAAVAREARRCARLRAPRTSAQLRLNPKLAAAFCHRLAALACGEGGAVARVAAAALAAVAPRSRRRPGASRRRTRTASSAASRAATTRAAGASRRGAVARVARRRPPPPRAPRAPPAARRRDVDAAPPAPPPRAAAARAAPVAGLRPEDVLRTLLRGRRRGRVGALGRGGKRLPALRDRAGGDLSAIAVAALRKLVLCRLLAGAGDPADAGRLPRYAPTCVSRAARAVAGAYLDLAAAFATDDDGAALAAAPRRTRTRWRATAAPTSRRASSARAAAAPPKSAWKPTSEFGYLLPRPPRPSTPSIRHRDGNDVVSMPRNLHAIE